MEQGFEVFYDYRLPIEKLCYMGDGERKKSSGKQRAYIHGLMARTNIDEQELLEILGIDIPLKDFSISEAGTAIEELRELDREQKNNGENRTYW